MSAGAPGPAGGRGIGAVAAQGTCHLTRRTGAGTRRQVDLEILFGEMRAGGGFAHFGNQGAPGIGKLLAGVAIPIGRIGDGGGHRQTGVLLTLRHQLQRPLGGDPHRHTAAHRPVTVAMNAIWNNPGLSPKTMGGLHSMISRPWAGLITGDLNYCWYRDVATQRDKP